jgi:glycosyltransferase involved in cell wall biosynthesis
MACGTPVLATDGSALREVVGEGGWLLPLDDTGAWVDALAKIATDDTVHARLASAGQARASRFTWAATAAATLAIYRRVLAGG